MENLDENNEGVEDETFDRTGTSSSTSVTDECEKFQHMHTYGLSQKIEKKSK